MTSSFRLFNLPIIASSHVLKNMDALSLLSLSFISTKTKNLVTSLNINAFRIYVILNNSIWFRISFETNEKLEGYFYGEERINNLYKKVAPGTLEKLNFVHICHYDNNICVNYGKFIKEKYELKDYIDHFRNVFHCSDLDLCFWELTHQFDIDLIYETFRNFKELGVRNSNNQEFNETILKKFKPVKSLLIYRNVVISDAILSNLLSQNFNSLEIDAEIPSVSFNDLLRINSKFSALYMHVVSDKDINKFIKCWMLGSNQRIERFIFALTRNVPPNKDLIFKNVKYQTMPENAKKLFKHSFNRRTDPITVEGGFNIKRSDGIEATVVLNDQPNGSRFEMYVWHSYCLV